MVKHANLTISQDKKQEDYESELVAEAKHDLAAFGKLYDLYVQPLYRYLRSRIGTVQGAEEVTSQTFLAALERFPHYKHQNKFAAWLFSIARNKTVDYFRYQHKQVILEKSYLVSAEFDPLQTIIKTEHVAELVGLISGLSEDERELIRLRYVAELRFREIAILVGRKEDTVKKSLYRLLARLQSQLEKNHD